MSGTDYTLTPNLGLFKPNYNADVDNWGFHLNDNCDTLDALLAAFATLATSTSYANDTAAATGGVAVGQLYRNGSAVMVRVS